MRMTFSPLPVPSSAAEGRRKRKRRDGKSAHPFSFAELANGERTVSMARTVCRVGDG
jgi:hypothetical protein